MTQRATIYPKGLAYGESPIKPLRGFPQGKARIRIRGNDFVRVFIKTKDGIQEYIPKIENENWIPGVKVATNLRAINT